MEPDLPANPQVEGKLAVREEDEAFLVVREEVPGDWLARFDKGMASRPGRGPRTWSASTTGGWEDGRPPPNPRHSASQLPPGLGAAMTTRTL